MYIYTVEDTTNQHDKCSTLFILPHKKINLAKIQTRPVLHICYSIKQTQAQQPTVSN